MGKGGRERDLERDLHIHTYQICILYVNKYTQTSLTWRMSFNSLIPCLSMQLLIEDFDVAQFIPSAFRRSLASQTKFVMFWMWGWKSPVCYLPVAIPERMERQH